MRAFNVNKNLDCQPILWVFQAKERIKWAVKLKQKVAAKYMVVKLIDIHRPGNGEDSLNFDMFSLEVEGLTLQI